MKLPLLILILTFTIANTAYEITSRSYNGINIGMTAEQALERLSDYVSTKQYSDDGSCYYLSPANGQPGANIMIIDGKVGRFDVYEESQQVKTAKGIGIGSTKKSVLAVYPDLLATEHEYLGSAGEYLTINQEDGFAIIFETYKDVVTSFRMGKFPAVGYIEGCS